MSVSTQQEVSPTLQTSTSTSPLDLKAIMTGMATKMATAVAKGVTQGNSKTNFTNKKSILKLQLFGGFESTNANNQKFWHLEHSPMASKK